MKTTDIKQSALKYSECYTVEDFINFYSLPARACPKELKAGLKRLGKNHLSTIKDNERDAIIALLA